MTYSSLYAQLSPGKPGKYTPLSDLGQADVNVMTSSPAYRIPSKQNGGQNESPYEEVETVA